MCKTIFRGYLKLNKKKKKKNFNIKYKRIYNEIKKQKQLLNK